jgi:hypothetical protein
VRCEDAAVQGCDDLPAAAWIAPRLGGAFGAVTRAVPRGYPAYTRICHPATDSAQAQTTWAHVARATGRRAHALMQWHAIAGMRDPSQTSESLWHGGSPRLGELVPDALGPLCDVLAGHTASPGDCWFGVWEGWGGLEGGGGDASPLLRRADPGVLHLPGRTYLLLTGPLRAALEIGSWPRPDWFIPQSPNIFWPADRAWFAATEVDFDSTLVGGSHELVDALLAAPELDSWPIGPCGSLAVDGDRVNPVA